eukprot:13463832-Heterocapsa_arctica.AAC.1
MACSTSKSEMRANCAGGVSSVAPSCSSMDTTSGASRRPPAKTTTSRSPTRPTSCSAEGSIPPTASHATRE